MSLTYAEKLRRRSMADINLLIGLETRRFPDTAPIDVELDTIYQLATYGGAV